MIIKKIKSDDQNAFLPVILVLENMFCSFVQMLDHLCKEKEICSLVLECETQKTSNFRQACHCR